MKDLEANKMVKSLYIHIPFCNTICNYCDFSKFYKNSKWINKYLNELNREIIERYNGDKVSTIYIGGGTPSCLNINQLKKLFKIIKQIKKSDKLEFTFECNIESVNYEKLNFLYKNGVNRLSFGVQSFNEKNLKYLNRNHRKKDIYEKINLAKKIGFNNINIDLIYAIFGETLEDLENDLDCFLELGINHISTYSLIIEPHTILYINNEKSIDEELDYKMYKLICNKLKKNGYIHYEVSNFSKKGYESKHNLTYWNNDEYYGFGIGASGYINSIRYTNTRSLNNYLDGKYVYEQNKLGIDEKIENEFILGLRKIKGIDKKVFNLKYNKDIKRIKAVNKLLSNRELLENKKSIYINPKYIYTSNNILTEFLN